MLIPGAASFGRGRRNWRGLTAKQIVDRLGLGTGLQLCLDAGDGDSYTSGDNWLDTSGNDQDFYLGADGATAGSKPTFNGTPGAKSAAEYWSFDGGDYFTIVGANPPWVENLHKDNATWTFAYVASVTSIASAANVFGTHANGAGKIGVNNQITTAGLSRVMVRHGAGLALDQSTAAFTGSGIPRFVAGSVDEAVGARGVLWRVDANIDTDTSTYTTPTASAATHPFQIGAAGIAQGPLLSGSKMWLFLMWRRALSAAELTKLYRALRPRFAN